MNQILGNIFVFWFGWCLWNFIGKGHHLIDLEMTILFALLSFFFLKRQFQEIKNG